MSYATITHLPDRTPAQVAAIAAAHAEEHPEGLQVSIIGESDHGLWIVDVFATQAQHDRFVTERLHPMLRRVDPLKCERMTHAVIDIRRFRTADASLKG